MTAEQLEAARAERMRQNGHGATTFEDVRTWIEETGLCIFLPRSAQAGFTAPTFVEAIAGQRTTEPTLELIATAESMLVRLESEGVAVRLNLAGQPGDQPDYVVAGWVLPYIYALRGDRDWRRSPQLTGSRQVSQLAVMAAKQIDSANLTAAQIRDLLGREVTETAVLRALHELWKQLRVIPVVPEVGHPALWQPLRQRFQKAIAEGASTSQVTAISVLASIYLQAVIAASMEDVELFLSPLTSRSKIREVVRGLAATRQVHSTNLGHSPMYYVAGTLPEFPVAPSFAISNSYPAYRGSTYLGTDPEQSHDDEVLELPRAVAQTAKLTVAADEPSVDVVEAEFELTAGSFLEETEPAAAIRTGVPKPVSRNAAPPAASKGTAKPAPRPRAAAPAHPRERSRTAGSGESRPAAGSDRRRPPMPRSTASNGTNARPAAGSRNHAGPSKPASKPGSPKSVAKVVAGHKGAGSKSHNGSLAGKSNGNGHNNGHNGNGSHAKAGSAPRPASGKNGWSANGKAAAHGAQNGSAKPGAKLNGKKSNAASRPVSRSRATAETEREPAKASAAKRYSFSGQAKQAPKPAGRANFSAKPVAKSASKSGAKPAGKFVTKAGSASGSKRSASPAHPASKRRG